MTEISNLNIYNTEMKKSMKDKLFFLDIIDKDSYEAIVDFGCADGTLLKEISEYNSNLALAGIDMNNDMLNIAKETIPNGFFMNSRYPMKINDYPFKSIMNLSSVLHEVYSYCSKNEEECFWYALNHSDSEYIVIRDMVYNNLDTVYISSEIENKVRAKADPTQLKEFEEIWGSIKYQKNLVHYLLKYRYLKNWSREVKENYLGYSTEAIIKNIDNHKYNLIYRKDYTLPFLYNIIKKDFNIELTIPTHTNLIFKRK